MKKLLIIILSLFMIVSFAGCSTSGSGEQVSEPPKEMDKGSSGNQGITVNDIKFEKVKLEALDKELKDVIEENNMEKGYKLLDDPSSEYKYLVVFAGEKPSAGYSIEIKKVIDNEGITNVIVTETAPEKGTMVAEVLTYPMDIVKLTGITDNINLTYENEEKQAENSQLSQDPNQSTSMIATTYVEGEYVGQIDPHTIEVKIEDKAEAFQLTDATKDEISSFKEGDIIGFDYLVNKEGQNILMSFRHEKQYVVGEYVGQIDPHSIEVKIEDGPVAFQLNDAAVEQVKSFKEGELVKIEFVKNDSNQMVANELIKVKK